MGFTRSSSGLIIRDTFGSDSSADYNVYSTGTLSVSGGVATISTGPALHTGSSGAKCVTAKGKRSAAGTRVNGPLLNVNNTVETTNDFDGYLVGISTNWYLNKVTNGSGTVLANTSSDVPANNGWGIARVYLTATGVKARCGLTSLSQALSSTDTTYTDAGYGGFSGFGESDLQSDDLDVRTSHIITCSGMGSGYDWLYASDGTTTAKVQHADGTASLDCSALLFPLASVAVYNGEPGNGGTLVAELDTGDYADMGGGDAFVYAAAGPVTVLTTVAQAGAEGLGCTAATGTTANVPIASAGAQGLMCSVGMSKTVGVLAADAGAEGLVLLVAAAVTVDVTPAGAGAESPPWSAMTGPVIDVASASAGAQGLATEIQGGVNVTVLPGAVGADGLVLTVWAGTAGLRRTYPAMVRTYPPLCRAA